MSEKKELIIFYPHNLINFNLISLFSIVKDLFLLKLIQQLHFTEILCETY